MDKPDNVLSLINLATVRSLEAHGASRSIRYAFARISTLTAPALGGVRLDRRRHRHRRRDLPRRPSNGRCGATNVNPTTGRRDLDIPGSLRATFGHKDLGVYLVVREGGVGVVGDPVGPATSRRRRRRPVPRAPSQRSAPLHLPRLLFHLRGGARPAAQAIAAGTPFARYSPVWRCPDCGTDKSTFRPYVDSPDKQLRTRP